MPKHSNISIIITEDVWLEILARLPVKTLLRFRSVCKTWRSFIDDPNFFCRLHLNTFKNNNHDTNLLVTEYGGHKHPKMHVLRSCDTLKTVESLGFPCKTSLGENRRFIICSTDGLVMLQSCQYLPALELTLWNPSIRKSRTLPPSPIISKGMKNVDLGFGFDPLIKEYKHVRLVCHDETNLVHSIAVYTIGTNLWKTTQVLGKGMSRWSLDCKCNYYSTVCFKGVLYFIAKKPNSSDKELIAFDLSKEVFASLSLPKIDYYRTENDAPNPGFKLVNCGQSLALAYQCRTEGIIWMSESPKIEIGSVNWIKCYKFAPKIQGIIPMDWIIPDYLYVKKNGDLLVEWVYQRTSSYNLETGKEKILPERGRHGHMKNILHYIESLVLMNG